MSLLVQTTRWLMLSGLVLFYACSDDSDPTGTGGSGGHKPVDSGLDQLAGGSGGVSGSDACFWSYLSPGCGDEAPDPVCQGGSGGLCITTFCGCDGVTFEGGCQASSVPFAAFGACDGGAYDAGDADACVWLYDAPGCGVDAPAPICTNGVDDACALQFCGCDGVTFTGGCGKSNVPFAAVGPCEGGAG